MATGNSWCTEGVKVIFENIFEQTTVEDLEIFTFSNNFTPVITCTDSDLTEIILNGLEKKDVEAADWSVAISSADVVATYNTGVGMVWTASGDQNLYGMAIRGKTTAKIYYVKNFGLKEMLVGNDLTLQPMDLKITVNV